MPHDLRKLYAEFPRSAIHWRAQSLTRDGTKAQALAYLDARDVMERLDEVVGPENWQDSYQETPSGRVLCTLSIKCGDFWIDKADGSGSTDIEGEKGGISSAFKRAAVKWGIGRYLYDMPNVWVPCETWTGKDGKPRWKAWKADPWTCVRNAPHAKPPQNDDMPDAAELPPVDTPKEHPPEVSIGMSIDTAQSEEALVHLVAECFRTWGERGLPKTIVGKCQSTASRLGVDMKTIGVKARAFNAAEYPKETAA